MGRKRGVVRQLAAGFAGSVSAFCAGSSFVWITPLLPQLQRPDGELYMTNEEASWAVAVIEIGNMISPMLFALLVNVLGRKWCLYFVGPIYMISWILLLSTRNIIILYISRIIQGFALGIMYTVLPMYLTEIAEPRLRGTLSTLFVLMLFLGIVEIYAVGPYLSYQNLTWVCFANPVFFSVVFIFFPESPWYLVMKNRQREATKALMWIRAKSADEVNDELEEIQRTIEEERTQDANWRDLFKTKVGVKALLLVQLIGVTQTMGGFTAVLSFATDSFDKSGLDWIDPHHNTLFLGISALISAVAVTFVADRTGRRTILLVSTAGCFLTMLTISIFFLIHESSTVSDHAVQWIPYIASILFVAFMNFGLVAMLTPLTGEYFPTKTRGIASGITAVALCCMSFVVLRIYLPIQEAIGLFVNFFMFSTYLLIGFVLIAIYLPETNNKTFDEIQIILKQSTLRRQ